VAFDPRSAPKTEPHPIDHKGRTHSRFWHRTGVNVGRRKGSISGAETHLVSQFIDLYREVLIKIGFLRADNTASEAAPELS
jgi:hypothetical protein